MFKKATGILRCINRGIIMIDCSKVIMELLMENSV